MPSPKTPLITLSDDQRQELEQLTRKRTAPQRLVERASIVLEVVNHSTITAVAKKFGRDVVTARKWVHRFMEGGLPALNDLPRSGAPRRFSP